MSDSQTMTAEQSAALFDRYTLPKLALVVILVASLVGTWLTTTLSGMGGIAFTVVKWAYFVALGVLTGGLIWKHLFVRPADFGDGAADYCAEMYDRFDYIAAGAIAVLAVTGTVVLWGYFESFGRILPVVGYGTLLGGWLVLATMRVYRRSPVERQFRSLPGLTSLTLAVSVVVATATAEVATQSLDPAAIAVRVLHLLAFVVWLGGAVWNIFVAVPTGQKRPTVEVVRAAGEQLERFRWAVRVIIPTLLLTGLYQAVDGLGTDVAWYLGNAVGLAVLGKIGFIVVLVGIFKLCPMWRACSPIEGVCELENIGDADSEDATPMRDESTCGDSEVEGDV